MLSYTGYAVVKHGAKHQQNLEMRPLHQERQIDIRDIAYLFTDATRIPQEDRHADFNQIACSDPSVCCSDPTNCSGVGADTCDTGVSFCCYVRGSLSSTPCQAPSIVFNGAGCEYDEYCGDDGNGNVSGVGYFPFEYQYCWYDFTSGDTSCFPWNIQESRPPQNLFVSWTLSEPKTAQLSCQTDGYNGFAYASYDDPLAGQYGRTGFERKHFLGSQGIFQLTYPTDFAGGTTDVTYAAAMESREYRTFIPLNVAGNEVGYCNSSGT